MCDSCISQLGQDVVRGHFLLSLPILWKHRFWKEFDLGQGSALTITEVPSNLPQTCLCLAVSESSNLDSKNMCKSRLLNQVLSILIQ